MPRKNPVRPQWKNEPVAYRFEHLKFSTSQLEALKAAMTDHDYDWSGELDDIVRKGWKLSLSWSSWTDTPQVSLTDKWQRPGCAGLIFTVEHSTLAGALVAVVYAAKHMLDEGYGETPSETMREDLW